MGQSRRQRARELSKLAREAAEVSALTRVRAQAALAELGLNCESVLSTPRLTNCESDAESMAPASIARSVPSSSLPVSSRSIYTEEVVQSATDRTAQMQSDLADDKAYDVGTLDPDLFRLPPPPGQ